jgi:tripartite ATP-independent transporter DctP family solute receptor
MWKSLSAWGVLLIWLVSVWGCDRMAEPSPAKAEIWRFAIEESIGSVQHDYAIQFERRIEAASDGRIDVVVYPYGSLGTSTQMTEQLNLGALEFAMCSPGSIGKFIPETQVFLLHFVLSEDDAINQQVLASPRILAAFDDLYEEKGLKLLSIFPEGEMVWTTQQEIRSPDDFRGVKMRVMTSPILIDAYNAYGASATPLPYSEVYSALQLGMVDAQVNPVFAIERQKFYEVTDWLIFPGHAQFVTTAAANREFYDQLSADDRELVDATIAQLNDFIFPRQLSFQTERLKKIIVEKLAAGDPLGLTGDLSALRSALSESEATELLDENELLTITRPLTSAERRAFVEASEVVKETFLEIGGDHAKRVLDLIQTEVRNASLDR